MSRFLRRKRKEVKYEEFGKGEAYHLKVDIDDKRFDIVAVHLPTNKKVYTKAKVGASKQQIGIEGERDRKSEGPWEAIIVTKKYGPLPLETWKQLKEKVANEVADTINIETGSAVNPMDIEVKKVSTEPEILHCPKCGKLLTLSTDKCPKCGKLIPYYY